MNQETQNPELHDQTANAPAQNASNEADGVTSQGESHPNSAYESKKHHHPRGHETRHANPGGSRHSSRPHSNDTWGWFGRPDPVATLQATNRELEAQVDQLRKAIESTKKELRGELMEKDAELAEMKKILCMYDDCSEVDIRNMVDDINKKIRGLARSVAVRWIKDASRMSEESVAAKLVTEEEVKTMRECIGDQLVNALEGARPGQSQCAPLFLQCAWQASIAFVATKILASFSARLAASPEGYHLDGALRSISAEVMKEEVQPAYGRWRFLTHRNLKGVGINEEQAIEAFANEALGYCRLAGRLIMKNRCPDDQAFANAFQLQMKEIMDETFKLLTNIQEKIMTTNYHTYRPPNGGPFSSETMDVDKQDRRYPNDIVVSTTGLGLLYSQKKGREISNQPPPMYVFKKPQVLTEKTLNEMIGI